MPNENDENVGSMRRTRAKAVAFNEPKDQGNGVGKKAPQVKKSRNLKPKTNEKRAALGDMSNVSKTETDAKNGKKSITGPIGLASKATTTSHGGGKKLPRITSSRSALGPKDNKGVADKELKRTPSGSGVLGSGLQRQNTNSTLSQQKVKKETPDVSEIDVEQRSSIDLKDEVQVEEGLKTEVEDAKQAFADAVKNLDEEDLDEPLMAAEYVVEIFDYLRDLEAKTMPNPDYMAHQEDLEWKMRGTLVDWLIEVHTRFKLLPETLFLAVNIIDRFLSNKVVQLDRLQLVGVTAMFIASKYEEVLSPHVGNFRHVADDGFTETEILSAERYVLSALDYDLSYPNPMNFLRRISKADNYDIQTRTLGKYLMEISLWDHRFMQYPQSHCAAASMYLARLILDRGLWDATIAHYSGYTEEEIFPVFHLMVDYLDRPVAHEMFFKKYARKKFLKGENNYVIYLLSLICVTVSILTRSWVKKYHALNLNVSVPTSGC